MYYHVVIETKEKVGKNGKFKEIYQLDLTNLEEIESDVISPYLMGEEFQFDGYFLKPSDVRRILVKETQKSAVTLAKYENDTMPANVFMIVRKKDVIRYDKHSMDLTKEVMSRVSEEIKTQTKKARNGTESVSGIDRTKVFIVHGHDDSMKLEVARFIEKLGYDAIILHEKPSKGKTIIEKIEEYSNVGFGIVLYSPCDVGAVASANPELKPRARQNVVFEHGYLIGKLNRENVRAIVKGQIEKPNDISGVVYISLENSDWKTQVAKEMQVSGYTVDMNKILST